MKPRAPRRFYLREWREFMGVKPIDVAIALDVERESYYRMERNWTTIPAGNMPIICAVIGIEPSQLWFPPPIPGQVRQESLDDLLQKAPEVLRAAAVRAFKGVLGED